MNNFPVGYYRGTVHGPLRFVNFFWRGKTFVADRVWNDILGHRIIMGKLSRMIGTSIVVIEYPRLGLCDYIYKVGDDAWTGAMLLGPFVVCFSLQKEKE